LDEAADGDTIWLEETGLEGSLTTTKAVTLTNSTESGIRVTVNGKAYDIPAGGSQRVSYTRPSSGGNGGGGGGETTYPITLPDRVEGGKLQVSPQWAAKGRTVTLTLIPDQGYQLESVIVTDSKGTDLALTDKGEGKFTFQMPAGKVTVAAVFSKVETPVPVPTELPFTDVSEGIYYHDAVRWAVEEGITNGTSATTFSPDGPCTRANIVTFLWRSAGEPEPQGSLNPFTDVVEGTYYYKAVLWAVEQGIAKGISATTFEPDLPCTRGQAVTFLWRAAGEPQPQGGQPYTDVIAGYYYDTAIRWAVETGVTNGTSATTFTPDAPCTRGQIVTFLWRALAAR